MLSINVSPRVYANLSDINKRRLDQELKKLNVHNTVIRGKAYNISMSDAYMLLYQRNVPHTNRTAEEILKAIDLFLNGAPPVWIKEHPEFKDKLFKDIIMPRAFTFTSYLYNVFCVLQYLESNKYYSSFQAVYYGYYNGYVGLGG